MKFLFQCVINEPEGQDVQWKHLPEEIQAYLNSGYDEDLPPCTVEKWKVEEVDCASLMPIE